MNYQDESVKLRFPVKETASMGIVFRQRPLGTCFKRLMRVSGVCRWATTGAFACALVVMLCLRVMADTGVPDDARYDASFAWSLFHLEVDMEDMISGYTIAPPPGTYVFRRGDTALLRAYDREGRLAPVRWSGDVAATSAWLKLDMDTDKSVRVSMPAADEDGAYDAGMAPWIEVPDDHAIFTFLGGGNLYGWFGAQRDRDHGAGLTHLTHDAYPHAPLWHGVSLGLEHIFSGAAADAGRARYTPRTDPMQFQVASPASVRVRWQANQSAWNMDCEMTYTFAGGDTLDIDFFVTPRDESFPLDYVVFMWAGYHQRFIAPAIFFPGIKGEETGWMSFGLAGEDSTTYGGAIPCGDMPRLPVEDGGDGMNLLTPTDIFHSQPFYFGLIDPSLSEEVKTAFSSDDLPLPVSTQDVFTSVSDKEVMAYIMMFERDKPVRFALWNWGVPPTVSAWDWQHVLRNPENEMTHSFRSRLLYTPFTGPESVIRQYEQWQALSGTSPDNTGTTQDVSGARISLPAWPELEHYWGPANASPASQALTERASKAMDAGAYDQAERLYRDAISIAPTDRWHQVRLGEILELQGRDLEALQLYQEILRAAPESPYTATNLDILFAKIDYQKERLAFWHSLHTQHPRAEIPALHLERILHPIGADSTAIEIDSVRDICRFHETTPESPTP